VPSYRFGRKAGEQLIVAAEERSPFVDTEAAFSYDEAFSRNIGWLTKQEQQTLRTKRIAIAGMGGVGGFHLLTLTRFGIGAFNIADGDKYELVNFNRQVGATLATIGRPKVEVMAEMARQVNPGLQITSFDQGLSETNLEEFLADVNLCMDGLDFFALGIRRKLAETCRRLNIPIVNAAPLGMGTAFLIFQPGGTSFEEWFRLDGLSEEQQYISYLVGMAPSALHRRYLVDMDRVDLADRRVPSTVAGCALGAGIAAVEAVKVLLSRKGVRPVPYYHHFDAYRGRLVVRKLRGGNRNPIQRIKIALARRFVARLLQARTGSDR
jgi:sulfur-carrier protein adenylyltransferase/sulfurtransferase